MARREAKNFYWAFRLLPRHKSDAMCAVYAFMRRADDIADDESKPLETRRAEMKSWLEAWRTARSSAANGHSSSTDETSSFLHSATRSAASISPIPCSKNSSPEPRWTSKTRELRDLERRARPTRPSTTSIAIAIWSHRSSAWSCIRIFGYSDTRAEKLAEETGVAFQLTNILRDVKEDVERGRVYLPLDLLDEFGVTLENCAASPPAAP